MLEAQEKINTSSIWCAVGFCQEDLQSRLSGLSHKEPNCFPLFTGESICCSFKLIGPKSTKGRPVLTYKKCVAFLK